MQENQEPSHRLSLDGEPERITMTLTIEGEDPAFASAVGLETIRGLQHEGYTLRPLATGHRGGEITVELVGLVVQVAQAVHDHHALISEGIQDIGGLVGIFSGLLPIYDKLFQAVKNQAKSDHYGASLIKITTEIDGHPITVEAADLTHVEAALLLAQRFHQRHPQVPAQAASGSEATNPRKVAVKGQVKTPPRKRPGRRR